MKKIIYIVLWIFALYINFENIYLVYAQLDDNFWDETEIQIEENKNVLNEESNWDNNLEEINNDGKWNENMNNVDNQDFTSQSDDLQETVSVTDVEITENVADIQHVLALKNDNIQVYEVTQVKQNIDTSWYWIIRIADPENPRKWITIHDRNLWATTTWYWASDDKSSYWYYFQWGNNYGFPTTGDIGKVLDYSNANIDASAYWPDNPYSSDTFIEWNQDWTIVRNNNLRWWSGDKNNNWWYPVTNATGRQWPCPTWYHVPSIWEFGKLIEFWNNEYSSAPQENKLPFLERFNIPIAGIRIPNIDRDYWVYLRSSSPKESEPIIDANYLFFNNTPNLYTDPRYYWAPIRCFYNSYRLPIKITYDINWWYWSWNKTDINWKTITYTKDDDSDYSGDIVLSIPKKSGNYTFWWWHTLTGDELRNWNISWDLVVYAKWLPFEDASITLPGINFTIMDRNLWSTNSWTGESTYGYYLTWWEEDIKCPAWYHIPSTWEWLWINKVFDSDFNWNYIKDLLNLPFAGKIENNEAIWSGEVGYYLAKNGEDFMYAKISNSDIEIKDLEEWEKVSVRCFKDYRTWTIIFNANGGNNIENITAVNRWEEWEDLQIPNREYSNFSWWYTTDNFEEWSKIEKNINYKNEEQINLYAKWDCQEWYLENENKCDAIYFDVTWIDGNWEILKTDSVKRWNTPTYDGDIPTKNSTSDYKYVFNNKWIPEISIVTWNVEYIAQFDEEFIKKSGWSSSWWGWKRSSTINSHWSADSYIQTEANPIKESSTWEIIIDNTIGNNIRNISSWINFEEIPLKDISELKKYYSQEFIDAYNFAKKYWITTTTSIWDAKMYSTLTRIEMAKMLSNFAINVLWKKPDISKWMVKFDDVTNKLNLEYGNAVTIAYQLGIMWQNIKSNRFKPNDEVTRAEFVTALSRMLYWIKDWKWKIKYYEPHISKLYNEWIINKTNPSLKEKKWYVMLILFRVSYHNQFKNN